MPGGRPKRVGHFSGGVLILYARVFPFLHHLIGASVPAALEDLLGVLHGREDPDRLVRRRAIGSEVGGRGVFEIRHVHGCRAVQGVERHVQRMPGPGELQAGIRQWVGVLRDGHFVIEPPAPLALAPEEVVDQPLHDVTKRPGLPAHRILEGLVPLRPRVFLPDRLGRLQQSPARRQRRCNLRTQLSSEHVDRLFDIDVSPVHLPGPEQVWESLKNVLTDHGSGSVRHRPAGDRGVEDLDRVGRRERRRARAGGLPDLERAAGVGAGAGRPVCRTFSPCAADLVGALGLDQVVDARAAAALVAVGDLDQLQAREWRAGARAAAARMPCAWARWHAAW